MSLVANDVTIVFVGTGSGDGLSPNSAAKYGSLFKFVPNDNTNFNVTFGGSGADANGGTVLTDVECLIFWNQAAFNAHRIMNPSIEQLEYLRIGLCATASENVNTMSSLLTS